MFKGGPLDWWSISALEGSLLSSVFWGVGVVFKRGNLLCANYTVQSITRAQN